MTGFVCCYREDEHSRGSAAADRLVLDLVRERLAVAGRPAEALAPAELRGRDLAGAALVLSMGRSLAGLSWLALACPKDLPVLNHPLATMRTMRENLYPILAEAGIPLPATALVDLAGAASGPFPCWLKRKDYHHVDRADVRLVADAAGMAEARAHFASIGYRVAYRQAHVAGEAIKFYGVRDRRNGMLRFFATAGPAPPAAAGLRALAGACASALGLDIFGGDAILDPGGRLVVVDVNAWPSYKHCPAAAADAIAAYALDLAGPA